VEHHLFASFRHTQILGLVGPEISCTYYYHNLHIVLLLRRKDNEKLQDFPSFILFYSNKSKIVQAERKAESLIYSFAEAQPMLCKDRAS